VSERANPELDTRAERFDLEGRSLRTHAARGTIVNTVYLIGLSVLGLLKGFVLAAFLTRSDYGIWGLTAVAFATLLWLKQAGIGDKYIQQDEPDQEVAFQKAFTFELLLTLAFFVVALPAVPLFALIYGEPRIIVPALVFLLALSAGVLQAPTWIFYRRMDFVRQRTLQAIDPVVGFVVSVVLAALGAGYWALFIGVVAGAWASAIATVTQSPYRLRWRFDRSALRSYASFSWPLFISNGSSLVIAQGAIIATQSHLGLAATGVVALAQSISSFTQRVDWLVTGTLYPAICAVKNRLDLLLESFVKSNRLALMWAVPFGMALTLFAGDLVSFGIGERWRPAVPVIAVFGATAAIGHIGFNWDAYFRARGETRPLAVAAFAAMLSFLLLGIPLLLKYGLPGFAAGIAVQSVAHQLCRAYYLQRLFEGFAFLRHAMRAVLPTLPAVAVVLLARLVEGGAERTAAMAASELIAYVVVTAAATWLFEGPLLREAFGYLRGDQGASGLVKPPGERAPAGVG
jgi:O-antigen/teichoic acid export membrane protein